MYGDSAFSNPALAEYKRAIEGIEKECKDSLVSFTKYIYIFFFHTCIINAIN